MESYSKEDIVADIENLNSMSKEEQYEKYGISGSTEIIYKLLQGIDKKSVNDVIGNNINDFCKLVMKDSNRNDYQVVDIISRLSIDSQKQIIDYISNNLDLIKDNRKTAMPFSYKFEFMSLILNKLKVTTIKDKSDILKEIMLNVTESKSADTEFVNGIMKKIDFSKEIPKVYEEMFDVDLVDMDENESEQFIRYELPMIVNYAFEKDEYALTNNDFIARLHQLLEGAESYRYRSVKDIFWKLENEYYDIDMLKYDDEINNLSDMNDSKFAEFMDDLKKLKNGAGTFPEKYCDYLIKQKLNSNSFLNKNLKQYFPIFKRAFEDKTQYVLNENGINDFIVKTVPKTKDGGLAYSGYRGIEYEEKYIENLNEGNMQPIDTLWHESMHAFRKKRIFDDKKVLSPSEYKMLKEYLIRSEDKGFYNRNYKHMYCEIDARIAGKKGAYKYLKQLGYSDKKILDMDGDDFFNCYETKMELENKKYELAGTKLNANGKREEVNSIFQNVLKKNPSLIDKHPILNIEFDKNGETLSGLEILKKYEYILKYTRENPETAEESCVNLFPNILTNQSPVSYDLIIKDSKELLSYETDDGTIKKYRDCIIRNEILNLIKVSGKRGKVYTSDKETSKEAKANFAKLVNNIHEFAQQHQDEPISEEIQKKIKPYKKKVAKQEKAALADIDKEVLPQERKMGITIIKNLFNRNKTRKNQYKEVEKGD